MTVMADIGIFDVAAALALKIRDLGHDTACRTGPEAWADPRSLAQFRRAVSLCQQCPV